VNFNRASHLWHGFDGTQQPPPGWELDPDDEFGDAALSLLPSDNKFYDYGYKNLSAGNVGTITGYAGSSGPLLSFGGSQTIPITFYPPPLGFMAMAVTFQTTVSGAQNSILGFNSNSNGISIGLHDRDMYLDSSGFLKFYVFNGSSQTVTSNAALNDGKPHSVVGVINGKLCMYVDGVLQTSTVSSVNNGYNGYSAGSCYLVIGACAQGTPGYFTGQLGSVSVFNRALIPSQIADLYYTPFRGFRPPAGRRVVVAQPSSSWPWWISQGSPLGAGVL